MKFTVVCKCDEEALKHFNKWKGYCVDGVKAIALDKVNIMDRKTREVQNHAYAFRCTGSIIGYLRHKKLYGKNLPHRIGWTGRIG